MSVNSSHHSLTRAREDKRFLVIGLVARKHTERHLQGELYLGINCVVYILGHCLLYLKVRYLLPIAPFTLFWAGQGFWVTVSWLQKLYARYSPRVMEPHREVVVTVFLICFIAASTLPKTLEPQRLTKLDRKEIGNKIAALFPEHPVVLASDERIGFHAKGQNVPYPKKIRTFAKFMEYARQFPVKVLAGLVLLSSARMAKYMTENVPGIFVPQNMIDELASAPKGEALARGIEIAGRMIAALKRDSICDGVHVMAIGKEELVPDILTAAGL